MSKTIEAAGKLDQVITDLKSELSAPKCPKTIPELWKALDIRLKAIEDKLQTRIQEGKGRGPISTRAMTEDDAKRIMMGDLKDKSIGDCAKTLGLSYGQIYSARNGYTFKAQYAEHQKALKASRK